MMRVLVCDDHVVFADALAYLIASFGKQVSAVTYHPDQAIEVLRRERVDICLLDVMFGTETVLGRLGELRDASPETGLVILAAVLDQELLAVARAMGVRGMADKRLPAAGMIDLLERVHAGESVVRAHVSAPVAADRRRSPSNDMERLAASLTPRERDVLGALVHGDGTRKLAGSLGIAPATARCHIQNVLAKLGAHSRLEAATSAVRHGMVSPDTGEWLLPDVR
jgi:two-component system, NarL family, nitrate/nitrite response regulator NarL